MVVTLRPHHLMNHIIRRRDWSKRKDGEEEKERCFQYLKNVYGEKFAVIEESIFSSLIKDPNIDIVVTESWDDLCEACSQRGQCDYEFDDRNQMGFAYRLGIPIGSPVKSGYAVRQITEYMDSFFRQMKL